MRRMAIALTAAALLVSASISAQAPPNFAGKWTLVPAADAPAGGKGGGGGGFGALCAQECTITQDAKTLTVERTTQAGPVKSTYTLDGSESKNTMAGRQGAQVTSVSTAKWEGAKLNIVTKTDMGGTMVEAKNVLSLEGGNLVVERTAAGREGGPTTTKQTYKKG
jgi:hypothetical protein